MNLGLDFKLTSWDKLFPGLQMENIWCVCVYVCAAEGRFLFVPDVM